MLSRCRGEFDLGGGQQTRVELTAQCVGVDSLTDEDEFLPAVTDGLFPSVEYSRAAVVVFGPVGLGQEFPPVSDIAVSDQVTGLGDAADLGESGRVPVVAFGAQETPVCPFTGEEVVQRPGWKGARSR